MGLDKQINEDHCYLEEAEYVAMNVEITDDNTLVNTLEKNEMSYDSETIISNNIVIKRTYEDDIKYIQTASSYLANYYPENCTEHDELFLHVDEKLVKPGDKFASLDDFVQYINENAKRWYFYYKCLDSHNSNTGNETYTYTCVYLKHKENNKRSSLRKRHIGMKTDCPCKIKLRHIANEEPLTVVYVCNHHDHELSEEEFFKLQHGRRLPPYIKEEIMDFLALRCDVRNIKAYVEMETGFRMSRTYFYTLERNMRNKNVKRYLTEERLNELLRKINSVDVNVKADDQTDQEQTCDISEMPKMSTSRRLSVSSLENDNNVPQHKRLLGSKTIEKTYFSKKSKHEDHHQISSYTTETLESVKYSEELVKCESQRNPWSFLDQCVPVQPKRNAEDSTTDSLIEKSEINEDDNTQNEVDKITYTIHYYDEDDDADIKATINNEIPVDINNETENTHQSNDGIVYETVVTEDNNTEINVKETESESLTKIDDVNAKNDSSVNIDNILNSQIQNTNDCDTISKIENEVEYVAESGEDLIRYLTETGVVHNANDIGIQTSVIDPSLVPVFDVYMKDGNVTGFVVNNNLINGSKDFGIDKEVQTNQGSSNSNNDLQEDLNDVPCDIEIIYEKNYENTETYTKHEYVHRDNIGKYMTQSHFPKYIKTLAKQTNCDVLKMLTNVYRERGMFKMTTTQRGKEGNTRIWYINETPRFRKRTLDTSEEIAALKEKIIALEKRNNDLVVKNKSLEDVALRLLNG